MIVITCTELVIMRNITMCSSYVFARTHFFSTSKPILNERQDNSVQLEPDHRLLEGFNTSIHRNSEVSGLVHDVHSLDILLANLNTVSI